MYDGNLMIRIPPANHHTKRQCPSHRFSLNVNTCHDCNIIINIHSASRDQLDATDGANSDGIRFVAVIHHRGINIYHGIKYDWLTTEETPSTLARWCYRGSRRNDNTRSWLPIITSSSKTRCAPTSTHINVCSDVCNSTSSVRVCQAKLMR